MDFSEQDPDALEAQLVEFILEDLSKGNASDPVGWAPMARDFAQTVRPLLSRWRASEYGPLLDDASQQEHLESAMRTWWYLYFGGVHYERTRSEETS